ncbi:MAG: hypothetical protein RL670_1016 [Actinomycetota bacterium]
MNKSIAVAAAAALAVSLSGCSMLYPNWGQKTPPIGTPSTSQQPSDQPSSSSSASTSASATPSAPAKQVAKINVVQSNVDSTGISVVAEAINFSEDGGSCILTYTNGTIKKTVTVKAEANATDTQCFPMNLPLTGLPKGPGLVTISYSSATHIGSSAAIAVTIP